MFARVRPAAGDCLGREHVGKRLFTIADDTCPCLLRRHRREDGGGPGGFGRNRGGMESRVHIFPIAALALAIGQSAHAQVYEIGEGGSLRVREGGGAVGWREVDRTAPAAQAPQIAAAVPSQTISAGSSMVEKTALRYGISPALLNALVWQESRWNHLAVSPKGAVGLTQLMPGTARAMGVDPRDPVANLDGGARYLRLMLDRFDGDVVMALAAYNAGPERVARANGVPPIRETREYVAAILARLNNHVR
jgi:hypothetical protein